VTLLLLAPILAPLLGAAAVLAVREAKTQRAVALDAAVIALAASGVAFARVVLREPFSLRGVQGDPWRLALTTACAMVVLVALTRRGHAAGTYASLPAALAAAALSLLSTNTLVTLLGLVATTAALGTGAYAAGDRGVGRAVLVAASSDVLIGIGLVLSSADGMLTPPQPAGAASFLLLGGALLRAGVIERLWGSRVEGHPGLDGVRSGPLRLQGLFVAAWVGSTTGWIELAAGACAVAAALAARRAARSTHAGSALGASAGLFLAGAAIGGQSVRWGMVLLAAGIVAGAVLAAAGRSDLGAATIGAAPLGASIAGGVLIVDGAFARAAVDSWFWLVAFPLGAALVWLGQAGARGFRRASAGRAQTVLAGAMLALVAAAAVLPGRVLEVLGDHAAQAAGAAAPSPFDPGAVAPAIGDGIGILFAGAGVVGVLGVLLAGGRALLTPAPVAEHAVDPGAVAGADGRGADAMAMLPVFTIAIAIGIAAVLFRIGLTRGFL